MTFYTKVRTFNNIFNCLMYNEFTDEVFEDTDLISLAFDLINEEVDELISAIIDRNRIKIIDAICDIMYTVYGAVMSFGISEQQIEYRINILQRYDIYTETNLDFFGVAANSLRDDLKFYIDKRDKSFIECTLAGLINLSINLGKSLGLDSSQIIQAFDLVHETNISKICHTEEEAIQTVSYHQERFSGKTDNSASYRKSFDGTYYIVYETKNGKILKPLGYKSVDLSHF